MSESSEIGEMCQEPRKERQGGKDDRRNKRMHQLVSDRQEFRRAIIANSPISFAFAMRIWGDDDVNLTNDTTRRAFFAVWAQAQGEYAQAVIDGLDYQAEARGSDD